MGTSAVFVGLKREADYSPLSNSEVKKAWSYTSNSHLLHDVMLS